MLKPARRNYNCSDADLKQTADHMAVSVTRDIADFVTYDVNAAAVTTFKNLITTFFNKTTDDESLGDQKTETDNKNTLRMELEELLRQIRTTAQLKYGGQGKYRKFGFDGFTRMSDNDLVRMIRRVQRVLSEVLDDMIVSYPFLNDRYIELVTKGDAFDVAVDKIIDKKNARDLATQERILAGNVVYTELFRLCTIGKALYQDTNEAKYNDYVLGFQGSGESIGLSGLITDELTGLPIGEQVYVGLTGTEYSTYSNENGQYEISPVAAGSYTVYFESGNYGPLEKTGVNIQTGVKKKLDVAMSHKTLVVGKITDQNGQGLSIIGVVIVEANIQTFPGPDGRYSITLTPGVYTFKFTSVDYQAHQVTNVIVTANQTTTLNAVMIAKTAIRGYIVDNSTGYPITVAAHITIPTASIDMYTDNWGNFEIEVTQPGTYTANITATGYSNRQVSLVFEQWKVKRQNLFLNKV